MRVRAHAARAAQHGLRAILGGGVGHHRPARRQPGGQSALEVLRERQALRRAGQRVFGDGDIVDEPAIAGRAAVGTHTEPDTHISPALERRQGDLLALPARPRGPVAHPVRVDRDPRLVRIVDLDARPVPATHRETVPESEHRPCRPAQVHRGLGVGIGVGQIAGTGRVSQRLRAAVGGLGREPPGTVEQPGTEPALEILGERRRIVKRVHLRLGGAVGGDAAVGIHGVDTIEVGRVEEQAGVGERGSGGAGGRADEDRVEIRAGGGRTEDQIMGEHRVGARLPREAHRGRARRLDDRHRHRGRRFGERDVIEVPAVGGIAGVAGEAEAHENGGLAVGGEAEPSSLPAGAGGSAAVGGEHGPVDPVVGGYFDEPVIAAGKGVTMIKTQHRGGRGGEIHRGGQRERLRADARLVVRAGGIAPGQRARDGLLGAERPRCIRLPCTAAALAVVEQRAIHPGRSRRGNLVAGGAQAVGVDHDHPVIISALGRNGDVGERRHPLLRQLAHAPGGAPVEAGRCTTIDLIRGETPRRRRPRQAEAGVRHAGRRRERHRHWRVADAHVVHVPAVADHGVVGEQAEAHLQVRRPGIGGEIELLGAEARQVAGIGGQRRAPSRSAVGRDFHASEVIVLLQRIAVAERQHRARETRQAHRRRHRGR